MDVQLLVLTGYRRILVHTSNRNLKLLYSRLCFDEPCKIAKLNYSTKRNSKRIYNSNVDTKVIELEDKLLYSDYVENNRLKLGFKRNTVIRSMIKQNEVKSKVRDLVTKPAYSVLLNDSQDSNISEEDYSTENYNEKSFHMPYSNIDKYEKVNLEPNSNDSDFDESIPLNSQYKSLYEKYLEIKPSDSKINFDNFMSVHSNSGISFRDEKLCKSAIDINLSKISPNWMMDNEFYDDSNSDLTEINYGTPDPSQDITNIACGGCGAFLHCKDQALPGYVPSEIIKHRSQKELQSIICQRCHFMKHYNVALDVKVSPEEYIKLLQVIKTKIAAIILMVDLTDFPCSIWPDIHTIMRPGNPIFVVGNKVDLLPRDQPQFFEHVKNCLRKNILDTTKIENKSIKDVTLISAKTGYGIENVINKLHYHWKYKGDVYIIGCTNVGKSLFFNTLINSDYCKVQAADLIQRATSSPWPGTTLNLLKFPILNPVRRKLFDRTQRLKSEVQLQLQEQKYQDSLFLDTRNLEHATLRSKVGTTFNNLPNNEFASLHYKNKTGYFGLNEKDPLYEKSRWCYDTPGTVHPDQILDLLTTEELISTLPQKIISPRTFVFNPNETLFLAGIGRLDFIDGNKFIRCTVFANEILPVTMCKTQDAEEVYEKLLRTPAFVVPINNSERLKLWPSLKSKEMSITGITQYSSAADIVFSNAGWVAITPDFEQRVTLKAWTADGRGLHLRTPSLLPKSVALRGTRLRYSPAYTRGRQIYVKP